jgi:hypothetical protein
VSKRYIALILLSPTVLVALFLVADREQIAAFFLGPVHGPAYFCSAPDPTPVADLGASLVLQECSAGRTVTVSLGETIAVDLQNLYGVDTSRDWHDLGVSDNSVLGTVVAPIARGVRPRSDEIAVYRALKAGDSAISAVLVSCTANFGGHCSRGGRWIVTVLVT